jgi:hypothetical protein
MLIRELRWQMCEYSLFCMLKPFYYVEKNCGGNKWISEKIQNLLKVIE